MAQTLYGMVASPIVLIGELIGADMNTTDDQAIDLVLPPGCTDFILQPIRITNGSISLTTAVGGIYTATAKGGLAIGSATHAYNAITATGPNATATLSSMSVVAGYLRPSLFAIPNRVYLSLTTPQGAAATADFRIWAQCWKA
jgi:hypothetical protein